MELKLKYLETETAAQVFEAVMGNYDTSKTAWVNAPELKNGQLVHADGWPAVERNISVEEALAIFNRKVNGAYTERLLLFMGQLEAIVKNGYRVALIQHQGQDGAPFDSDGWLVAVVEGIPIYHIAPWGLNLKDVEGLVTLVPPHESQNELVAWKRTDKFGESMALNATLTGPGKDLVGIAQAFSTAGL